MVTAPPRPVSIARVAPLEITRGQAAQVRVKITVDPGFHVQANPASNPQLIPTRLEVAVPLGMSVGEILYPAGKPYRLAGADKDISTYDGTFEVIVSLTATAQARRGSRSLRGKLRYQACDDKNCFFPQSAGVALPVIIK